MDLWEILLIPFLIAIIVPIVFSIFWFFKVRGEKKIAQDAVIRTRPPKILSGFFLGFALLVLFGGIAGIIYCCITDRENTTVSVVITMSACVAAFSALGFFGYAYARFHYVVADSEGIRAYRLFRKTKCYRYEEIGYFHDTLWAGAMGSLKGYDANDKVIFSIDALHIGASAVAQRLREHNVQERGQGQLNPHR